MCARTAESPIDMGAVGRLARRVNLENLVLVGINAKRFPGPSEMGVLDPDVKQTHRVVHDVPGALHVESKFEFAVRTGDVLILEADLTYRLFYSVSGDEPVDTGDSRMFARANGAYHSWPFVREQLYSLTSKMGLPPFMLPVLSFHPPKQQVLASESGREPHAALSASSKVRRKK